MRFYKNKETNEVINSLSEITDDKYILLNANTIDASTEKHLPVYTINDNKIYVKVGSVNHPMEDAHYIMWIALVHDNEIIKVELKPNDKPEAIFPYMSNAEIYAYCNLHGLWKTDLK